VALNGLLCADVALRNYPPSHSLVLGSWHGVAVTRCVESTKLLYGGLG